MRFPDMLRSEVRSSSEDQLRFFVIVGNAAMLGWCGAWWYVGLRINVLVLLATSALLWGSYLLRRYTSVRVAANLSIAVAFLGILALGLMTGGVTSLVVPWFVMLPIVAAPLVRVRDAMFWGVLLVATPTLLWVLEGQGYAFPNLVPPTQRYWLTAASHVTSVLAVVLLSLSYANAQRRAFLRLQAAHSSVEAFSRDLTRRAERLEVLNDVARVLASEHSLDDLYRALCTQVGRVLRRDAFYVARWTEGASTVRYPLMYDEGMEYAGDVLPLGDGPTSRAIRERRTIVERRTNESPARKSTRWGNQARASRAAIHVPMVKDGRVLGVLSVHTYEGDYSEDDVRLCEGLADQAAVAVENASLYQQARASESRFRELLGAIERMEGHNVVVVSLDGVITYAAGTDATHGYSPEELIGQPIRLLGRHAAEAESTASAFTRASLGGRPWTQTVTATRRDGQNFPILISTSPFYTPTGEVAGTVCIGRDLTEQIEGQRHLLQSAKLACIGELVAGVAHELNNPLTIVKSAAYLLAQELEGTAAEDARVILEGADRAAKIVRNLLHFARQTRPERGPTDLNEVVERVLRFREAGLATNNVAVERSLRFDLPQTIADASQIEQVVLNLINNAERAMTEAHGRGTLTLRTEAAGGRLRLTVSDDGPGIPADILPRIFDPFFTTRAVGEGTGLGLAVSHGIVSEHGGSIEAVSEPGCGATFVVELPVVAGVPEPPPAKTLVTVGASRPKHLLLVDDEDAIRGSLRRYLERRGHRVAEAESGEAALRRLSDAKYDRIVLDLKMPGMSGEEVYRAMLERHHAAAGRVIFATGDVVSPATEAFLLSTGNPVFEKPYEMEALARLIEA